MAKRRRSSMKNTSMNGLFLIFLAVVSLITYFIVKNIDKPQPGPPSGSLSMIKAGGKMGVLNDIGDGAFYGILDVVNEGYDDCMGSKCICKGINGHVCINSTSAQSFYNAGLITENTIPPNGVAPPQYMQSGPMCY